MVEIDISFEKTTLGNGLRVITHRDPKTPIVTLSVWYHVGSKNESPGRTGFAHLFEHLMFEGSAHHRDEYFRPLEHAGASLINGTTNRDRTNYFETVPASALDVALWLESDRMGHLLPALSQSALDEQRDVVRNEKRQTDNQPYGRVSEVLARALYPGDHPYSWPVIGRIEDLDRATLEDVRSWFDTWYRPSNAVVVVSGDIDPQTALRRVEDHFGGFAPGGPLERPGRHVAPLGADRQVVLEDRVPQARIYRVWNVPPVYEADHRHLGLLTRALAQGKSSRLYERLVHRERLATDVSAYLWSGEMGSSFVTQVSCAPDVEVDRVERALESEISRLLNDGLDDVEVERSRMRTLAAFARGFQRSGGFGGKSEILAHGEVFRRDPGAFRESLGRIREATAPLLAAAAERWLSGGSLTLRVVPFPTLAAGSRDIERGTLPEPGRPEPGHLPLPESHRLDGGLEVLFLRRDDLPLALFRLVVDSGFATEGEAPRGTASLTMAAIDEGTRRRSSMEISHRLAELGARLGCGAGLDHCRMGISTLAESWDEALTLLGEVALELAFPESEIERLKAEQIARIRRQQASPVQLVMRVLPQLLYGERHPYSLPFTGSGSVADVRATERHHLTEYQRHWVRPQHSTLLCLGDLDRDAVLGRLQEILSGWESGPSRIESRPAAPSPGRRRVLLLDRPGSIQSIVFGGQLVPPRTEGGDLEMEAFHYTLGGAFTSRLNMNLREDKGWTYGAHSLLWDARGQRPFLLYTSVQADATAGAIREMDVELRALLEDRPISAGELERAQRHAVLTLPARRETLSDIADDVEEILVGHLPRDYYDGFADRVNGLSTAGVTELGRRTLDPDRFTWVVVADLERVRQEIEGLEFARPEVLDAEGRGAG